MFSFYNLELGATYRFRYDHLDKLLSEGRRMFSFWGTLERASPMKAGWLTVHRLTYTKVMGASRISREQPLLAHFRYRPDSESSSLGWLGAKCTSSVISGSLPWLPFNPAFCPPKRPHSILCLLPSSHCWVMERKSVPHLTMSYLKVGVCRMFLSLDHSESTWDDAIAL